MATIAAWRGVLAGRLNGITSLNVYDKWPDKIIAPAAIILPSRREFDTFNEGRTIAFTVLLIGGSVQKNAPQAQVLLDSYIEESGTDSVINALEDGQVAVTGWQNYDRTDIGTEVDHWAVEVSVEVLDG